jgi:hypothetical protein
MAATYEVLALRYGIFDGRLQFQNYLIPDDHAAPDPLDFYVFAIRGHGRTIVMDTGCNPVSAQRRGRELLRTPAEGTAAGGHRSGRGAGCGADPHALGRTGNASV